MKIKIHTATNFSLTPKNDAERALLFEWQEKPFKCYGETMPQCEEGEATIRLIFQITPKTDE